MSEFRARQGAFSGPRAKIIWPHEVVWLNLSGKSDGRNGEPAPSVDGEWTSAFLKRLTEKARDYQARQWLQCRQKTAPRYVALKRDIGQMDTARADLERASSQLSEAGLTPEEVALTRPGEEVLDPRIPKRRRVREHAKRTASLLAARDAAAARVSHLENEIADLTAQITEHEAFARMRSHRYVNVTDRKIAIYWRRAMRGRVAELDHIPLPPTAPITGEDAYRAELPDLSNITANKEHSDA